MRMIKAGMNQSVVAYLLEMGGGGLTFPGPMAAHFDQTGKEKQNGGELLNGNQ